MEQRDGIGNQNQQEKQMTEALPAYLAMYEISGQDNITPHSFERYLNAKKNYDEKIRVQAQDKPEYKIDIKILKGRIQDAPEGERAGLVRDGLTSNDIGVYKACASMLRYVPESDRAGLIRDGWANDKIWASHKIEVPKVWKDWQYIIRYYMSAGDRAGLIRDGLASDNIKVQRECAQMIVYLPEGERESFWGILANWIKAGLASDKIDVQRKCVDMIVYLPEGERESFWGILANWIRAGLASDKIDVQRKCVDMIVYLPEGERESLGEILANWIKAGLASDKIDVQRKCVDMIVYLPKGERESLGGILANWIRAGLATDNIEVYKVCVSMIRYVLADERARIIRAGLASDKIEVRKACAYMIRYAHMYHQNKLFHLAIKNGVGNCVVEPPLYANTTVSKESFSRGEFQKTGSETTLIGGELIGKTIIRHITPIAFMAWQRLYEDYQLWQSSGFDYVPIEPIHSFRLNKKGMVDVYAGVLDLNLDLWTKLSDHWIQRSDQFIDELGQDSDKILDVLERNNIQHCHTHAGNFCLKFFRDESGNVDFSKKPRIYLIDFDRAISP